MNPSMNRRDFIYRMTGALGLSALSNLPLPKIHAEAAVTAPSKPNILFIFADDFAYDCIHALGNTEISTPHLDTLVKRGAHFKHCYNQGGWHGAICVASRTMLLTGRFLWNAAALDPRMEEEAQARRLWPQHLEQAGYRTCMSGKWHVNCPANTVFQTVRHVRPGMPPDIPEQYDRPQPNAPDAYNPADPALGGHFTGGKHWSEVLADDGVDFLKESAASEAPFFLYLAFNAPHDPRQFPAEYGNQYALDAIATPDNFQPLYPDKEAIGCSAFLRDERLAPFPRTEHAVRVQRKEYYGIISHLDAQVGRILNALEETGQADNTYIFFTADNGLAVGRHGFMGKQNMYEHSMKTPLIIVGPTIEPDKSIDAPVYLQDIMPTTLDLAGIPAPGHVQYKSLLPLFRNAQASHYPAVYGAYMNLQRMVRMDNYKLIYYPKLNRCLLFDLDADPWEMNNLAEDPNHASRIASLLKMLHSLQQETGDALAVPL